MFCKEFKIISRLYFRSYKSLENRSSKLELGLLFISEKEHTYIKISFMSAKKCHKNQSIRGATLLKGDQFEKKHEL